MKKQKINNLDDLNNSLLLSNQKAMNRYSSVSDNASIKKSEKKLHKTVVKLFGR